MTDATDMFAQYFALDEDAGTLAWIKKPASRICVGAVAGSVRSDGYGYVHLLGKRYGLHQVVFAMVHGYIPKEIDHADGNPSNNRPANLREATRSQNNCNRRMQSNNTSGFKGVYLNKRIGRWHARIKVDGRFVSLKYHKTPEAAGEAYLAAVKTYHGNFAPGAY